MEIGVALGFRVDFSLLILCLRVTAGAVGVITVVVMSPVDGDHVEVEVKVKFNECVLE